ncbi:glycosyltransferase family 2 protein [Porphyromonas sp.]
MKLAVIVPVYKVEPYLRQCIDSILSQSYQDLKVILVDDGSPDSCGAICDEYAARDPRVLALHKPNGGLSSARNFALPYIEDCPLVTFVDSDDWLEPEIYERCVHYLKTHSDVSIVNFGYNLIVEDEVTPLLPTEECLSRNDVLLHYISISSNIINTMVWSRIYRREILQGMSFVEGHKWEDVVYVFEALYRSTGTYHILPFIGINYRSKRPGAITADLLPDKHSLFADIAASTLRYPDDDEFKALANTLAVNCLWYHAKYLLTFPYSVAVREFDRYLPTIEEIKNRPYLDEVYSRSKVRKVKFFLEHPRLYFRTRSLFRKLFSRKKSL